MSWPIRTFIAMLFSFCYHAATRTGQSRPVFARFPVNLLCCLDLLKFVNRRSGGVHKAFKCDAPRAVQAFAKAINSRWGHQQNYVDPRKLRAIQTQAL